jgi:predicted flavoprotein YhiN
MVPLSSRLRDAIASAEGIQTADAVEPAATIQTADAVGTYETAGGAPQTEVKVDLRPDLTVEDLTERLSTRRPKESLSKVLRRAAGLPQIAVALLREGSHELPTAPAELAELIKSCPVQLSAAAPIDRAISTAGGVAFSEVNSDFMLRSRPGCFVAGEMLDWEAPTGGFLLQATFSTAVAAADGAVAWIRTHSATPSGSEEI